MVLLHGFTDTWETWSLVLDALEARHEVLAPTLAGHAGGPAISGAISDSVLADGVERAMDDAGFETAHIVGNSLGGYLALQLAARGRAKSVVALAPAGGWAADDDSYKETLAYFTQMQALLKNVVPHVDAVVATPEGRRQATAFIAENYEHIPAELIAHQILGAAECDAAGPLIDYAIREGWHLDAERVDCPVRLVWGTEDKLLVLPGAAVRFREDWLPSAEWIELEGVGHCPQLDAPGETAELILGHTSP